MSADTTPSSPADAPRPTSPRDRPADHQEARSGAADTEPDPELEAFLADKRSELDDDRSADADDLDEVATWPDTPAEMDEALGIEGTEIPDGPTTPGRNKVEWDLPDGTKVTYEQHPYHPNAPAWHREPHWHYDKPGQPPHRRALPGDPFDLMED